MPVYTAGPNEQRHELKTRPWRTPNGLDPTTQHTVTPPRGQRRSGLMSDPQWPDPARGCLDWPSRPCRVAGSAERRNRDRTTWSAPPPVVRSETADRHAAPVTGGVPGHGSRTPPRSQVEDAMGPPARRCSCKLRPTRRVVDDAADSSGRRVRPVDAGAGSPAARPRRGLAMMRPTAMPWPSHAMASR